jgi:hypothetical protein
MFCIHQILKKKLEYNETVHQLIIEFKKARDSVRMEVLYSIFIEFEVPMRLIRLVEMCLGETFSEVPIGKCFSNVYVVQNGINKEELFAIAFELCFSMCQKEGLGKPGGTEIKMDTYAAGLY